MLSQIRMVGLLQLQFQQALLALPGMEGRIVAVAVPAGPDSSAWDGGQGCCSCSCSCSCSFSRSGLLWGRERIQGLTQTRLPVVFTVARPFRYSKLCQGWRAGSLQLQFQQALLALTGTASRVVAVAVPAGPASSARVGGHTCCSSSRSCWFCQGWMAGLLQLQFQQALLTLPGMESRLVVLAVPAGHII